MRDCSTLPRSGQRVGCQVPARIPGLASLGWLLARLRRWSAQTAHRVDAAVASSEFITRRIRESHGRRAVVVHSPIGIARLADGGENEGDDLLACRFVPYKRADMVVESFTTSSSAPARDAA